MDAVQKGDRIRLIATPQDPDPIPAGSEGVVVEVTDGAYAQIIVDWRNVKRSLALVPGVDEFEVIAPASGVNATSTEPGYGDHPVCATCPWKRTMTVYDPARAVTVPNEVYEGIEAVRMMGAVDLSERAAFARVARWAGFRTTADWIEDEQNRVAWEQGIQHGFRVEKEQGHGKRCRRRP